jgi:uncharacterized membrane protein YdjX (TVP38/TMEM64 family)/rhodanese-related sulfurtransferase
MSKRITQLILFAVLTTGIAIAVFYRDQFDAAALEQWINDAGTAGPVVFVIVYALATVFFLPGSVLTLLGGALFGPLWGTIFNLTGATLGAALSFLLARYLAAHWVEQKTGGRLKQLKQGIEVEGWRFVAFTRLVPLFPFNLLNYALGLTRINFSQYVFATFVFMIPGGFAYTWLGYAGREAIAGGEGLVQKIMLAIALLALVAFIPRIIGMIRQKPMIDIEQLKQCLDKHWDFLLLDVRASDEFVGEQGHVPGAKNIPLEELPQRLADLADYEEKTIVTICRTDQRSAKAAQLLAQKGFADVHVVKGGMTDWNSRGYKVQH